jgi:hypothetical protein
MLLVVFAAPIGGAVAAGPTWTTLVDCSTTGVLGALSTGGGVETARGVEVVKTVVLVEVDSLVLMVEELSGTDELSETDALVEALSETLDPPIESDGIGIIGVFEVEVGGAELVEALALGSLGSIPAPETLPLPPLTPPLAGGSSIPAALIFVLSGISSSVPPPALPVDPAPELATGPSSALL